MIGAPGSLPPWQEDPATSPLADKIPGGYVVRAAIGQVIVPLLARERSRCSKGRRRTLQPQVSVDEADDAPQ
jgi:hypothetical protein